MHLKGFVSQKYNYHTCLEDILRFGAYCASTARFIFTPKTNRFNGQDKIKKLSNWLIYNKQQRSNGINTTVNKQNDYFLNDRNFTICSCFKLNCSSVTVCHSLQFLQSHVFPQVNFSVQNCPAHQRKLLFVSLERSSMFFASHGEQRSTSLLALKPLKCWFSFSCHFSKNDNDGEDFICRS